MRVCYISHGADRTDSWHCESASVLVHGRIATCGDPGLGQARCSPSQSCDGRSDYESSIGLAQTSGETRAGPHIQLQSARYLGISTACCWLLGCYTGSDAGSVNPTESIEIRQGEVQGIMIAGTAMQIHTFPLITNNTSVFEQPVLSRAARACMCQRIPKNTTQVGQVCRRLGNAVTRYQVSRVSIMCSAVTRSHGGDQFAAQG